MKSSTFAFQPVPLLTALWFLASAAWSSAATHAAVTNDFNQPIRFVHGQRIDLTPLIQWYQRKFSGKPVTEDNRPLSAWHLVHIGRVTPTNGGWMVEGAANGEPCRFLLLNPPRPLWETFQTLKTNFEQLTAQTNQLQRALQRVTKEREQAQKHLHSLSRGVHKWAVFNTARQRANSLEHEEAVLSRELDAAQSALEHFDTQGWDLKKPFALDCLALKTLQPSAARLVYDRGLGAGGR